MFGRQISWLIVAAEVLVLGAIGAIINWRSTDETLINIYWVMSVVLVMNRLVLVFDLRSQIETSAEKIRNGLNEQSTGLVEVREQLVSLGRVLDLRQGPGVDDVVAIGRSYTAITNPRLQDLKEEIVRSAKTELETMQSAEQTGVLDQPDFYRWLFREFDAASGNTHFRIVSMDEDLEWTDTYLETQFWEKNIAAARRGATIERIFVFAEDRLKAAAKNPSIYAHRKGSQSGVIGKYVERADFESQSPTALAEAGQGFILVDSGQAIVDVFSSDGRARGYVTFNGAKVRSFRNLFDKFDAVARPLDFDGLTTSTQS